MNIAVGGPMGSGKSSVAEALQQTGDYLRVSFAAPLKEMEEELRGNSIPTYLKGYFNAFCAQHNTLKGNQTISLSQEDRLYEVYYELLEKCRSMPLEEGLKQRARLQFLGEGMRQRVSLDFWAMLLLDSMKRKPRNTYVVVDDLRYLNEFEVLSGMGGWAFILLTVDGNTQASRLKRLYGEHIDITRITSHASEREFSLIKAACESARVSSGRTIKFAVVDSSKPLHVVEEQVKFFVEGLKNAPL